MNPLYPRFIVIAGLALLFSAASNAAELSAVNDFGQYGAQTGGSVVPVQNGSRLQQAVFTGTVSTCDTVFDRISVKGASGTILEFILDANTPLTDHNQQIGIADLHVGDQVSVRYNVNPQKVNAVERI